MFIHNTGDLMIVIRTISDKTGVASTCSTSMVYYQHYMYYKHAIESS